MSDEARDQLRKTEEGSQESRAEIVKVEDIREAMFRSMAAFELGQRMARCLAASDLVPAQFRGNIANTLIALELSNRIGASPFAVMQNIHVINGKPGWSSTFIIASLNSCGRFSPLRYDMQGEEGTMSRSCAVWAYDKTNGEKLVGPRVTMKMAEQEKWIDKNGSKWKTMPELMLRYRAATFFGRLYAPDVLAGMKPSDEIEDIGSVEDPFVHEMKAHSNQEVIDFETGEVVEPTVPNPAAKPPEQKPQSKPAVPGHSGGNGPAF